MKKTLPHIFTILVLGVHLNSTSMEQNNKTDTFNTLRSFVNLQSVYKRDGKEVTINSSRLYDQIIHSTGSSLTSNQESLTYNNPHRSALSALLQLEEEIPTYTSIYMAPKPLDDIEKNYMAPPLIDSSAWLRRNGISTGHLPQPPTHQSCEEIDTILKHVKKDSPLYSLIQISKRCLHTEDAPQEGMNDAYLPIDFGNLSSEEIKVLSKATRMSDAMRIITQMRIKTTEKQDK